MSKRLVKRHKRQVARAKQQVRLSTPDLRSQEEIMAAREASRPAGGWRSGGGAGFPPQSAPGHSRASANSTAKGDS